MTPTKNQKLKWIEVAMELIPKKWFTCNAMDIVGNNAWRWYSGVLQTHEADALISWGKTFGPAWDKHAQDARLMWLAFLHSGIELDMIDT